jgi:hypothetical protein
MEADPESSQKSEHDSLTARAISPVSEDIQYGDSREHRPRHQSRQNLVTILATVIITLIMTTVLQQAYHLTTFSPSRTSTNVHAALYSDAARLNPTYHCGNSSTEAISLGCIFDLSVVGYIPAPCFNQALNQRFLDFGWKFYEDQNGTIEVSVERLAASAGTLEPFWAPHGYHITHCALAWERMHLAMKGEGTGPLTSHLLELEHTKHCGMMIELRDDLYSLNSQITPLLNTC